MKFSPTILVIFAFAAEVAHADFFRNDFLPVGHARTDAIIDPNCLSDHVHTFYGPPLLYPALTFEDLRNSDPSLSSGNIEENNSLYWHPAVYHVANNGKKTLQESEMTTIYYIWIPGETTAFPPNFRMVTPGEDVFNKGIVSGESEMELSISFQSCWDGVNLDSPDHMSHVAFPEGKGEKAPCPSSHPVRIPRLDFFIRWFNTPRAKWRFADDSIRFHADYVSGWDESFLQSLLDGGDGDVDNKVTFRAGIKHDGNDQKLIKKLNKHAVPKADTSCITTEIIDNVVNLPRGSCTGTLISPIGVCGVSPAPTKTPSIVASVAPTAMPTIPPSSSPAPIGICNVMEVLGQTVFVSGAGACWRIQLGAGGTIERDIIDKGCSNTSNWTSSSGVFSLFNGVDISQGTAAFIPGENGFSGTIRFKENPSVTMPVLNLLSFNDKTGVFSIEIVLSTCSGDVICPAII